MTKLERRNGRYTAILNWIW